MFIPLHQTSQSKCDSKLYMVLIIQIGTIRLFVLPRISLDGKNEFLTLQKPVVTTSRAEFGPSSINYYIGTWYYQLTTFTAIYFFLAVMLF